MSAYRVKLYDNVEFPKHGFNIDVSTSVSNNEAVTVTPGVSCHTGLVSDTHDLPVIIFTRVERAGDPIIGARVEAEITGRALD